jgi:hypothetical protein
VKHSIPARVMLCLIAMLAFNGYAKAQLNSVDVSSCFSDKLVTTESRFSETNWQWYYLSIITKDNYSIAQSSKNASLFGGLFAGSWDEFNVSREQYFEERQESLSYYNSMASNVSYLPESWRPVIQSCIDGMLHNAGKGLTYLLVNSSESRFRLEVKYVSTEPKYTPPTVTSSEIIDGYVEVEGTKRRTLYPPCDKSAGKRKCPSVDSRSEFIVYRDNPNKVATIALNLSNTPQSTSFDVPFVAKKQNCQGMYEGSPRKTIHLGPTTFTAHPETWGSGGWQVNAATARTVAPGRITAINSYKVEKPNINLFKWDADQSRAVIMFSQMYFQVAATGNPFFKDDVIYAVAGVNGSTDWTIAYDVEYQHPRMVCTDVDWPVSETTARSADLPH